MAFDPFLRNRLLSAADLGRGGRRLLRLRAVRFLDRCAGFGGGQFHRVRRRRGGRFVTGPNPPLVASGGIAGRRIDEGVGGSRQRGGRRIDRAAAVGPAGPSEVVGIAFRRQIRGRAALSVAANVIAVAPAESEQSAESLDRSGLAGDRGVASNRHRGCQQECRELTLALAAIAATGRTCPRFHDSKLQDDGLLSLSRVRPRRTCTVGVIGMFGAVLGGRITSGGQILPCERRAARLFRS